MKGAFQICLADNVATALAPLSPGLVPITGECCAAELLVAANIPAGHKLALRPIDAGESIVKYGVVIGRATADIATGTWVHLHCMKSLYDERSSHLDAVTGAPQDISYE